MASSQHFGEFDSFDRDSNLRPDVVQYVHQQSGPVCTGWWLCSPIPPVSAELTIISLLMQ